MTESASLDGCLGEVRMSAAEEDTELRDLLVQTLENSGVLNKIKAELRAAVFLALEEQEKVENKTPLVNESLKKFLNTKDGHLVTSLVAEFLQFFNLDFTLSVFQPETNTLGGLESREDLARTLGIHETEGNNGAPLLLEVMKHCRQKQKASRLAEGDRHVYIPKELSPKQIAEAKKKFDFYDQDKSGEINKDELRVLFMDLFPHFHRNMLERYVNDELKAVDKDFNNEIDFDEFLGMYKRLFIQCRTVVAQDVSERVPPSWNFSEGKPSPPVTASKVIDHSHSETSLQSDMRNKSNIHSSVSEPKLDSKYITNRTVPDTKKMGSLSLDDVDDDEEEGDSFFDDPLPKLEKAYGCTSGKISDTDEDTEDPFMELGDRHSPIERREDSIKPVGNLASLSDNSHLKTGLGSLTAPLAPIGADSSNKATELKEPKTNEKNCSLELGAGDEDDYDDDDFNSTSHRSDKTKSEVSIGEEIEEEISIEGDDFNASDNVSMLK
nr:PREDICTED: FGFR1 oncogene partner isoform X1 [Latimeria chalumnae]|eukprot:XP_005993383.1 PREDICTED: FGFR1 oncogene partner isoform X1 [Latimeria chalumnae]